MGQRRPNRVFTGLALRFVATALVATMAALVKMVEQRGASLPEAMFFRQAAAVPLVTAWIAAGPGLRSIATHHFPAHLTRTVVGLTGMTATFGAVFLLPLAEATTLQFTAPIFGTMLGALVLKERVGIHRWGAVMLGFLGILVIASPGDAHFPLVGTAVGLAAALLAAVISILLRQLGRTESSATTVFWFSTLSVPPLLVVYLFNFKPHDGLTWMLLVGVGLVGGLAQLALTASVRFAPVSTVIPMDYTSLIWGTLYGYVLFAMLPHRATWIGAPLIIASGLYIVYREHRLRIRETEMATAAA